jgi:hypothetical protein
VSPPRVAVVVPARDRQGVEAKIAELEALGLDFVIVCGDPMEGDHILYRPPAGKYDAVNAGLAHMLARAEIVVLNDVDTRIEDLGGPVEALGRTGADMVFCRVAVASGPQREFYRLLDLIRDYVPVASSGELVVVRASSLAEVLPIPPTLTDDTWLLFKFLERGRRVVFWKGLAVSTRRTETFEEEAAYKQRNVYGIYQALALTRPGVTITMFYALLPFLSPVLLLAGPGGRAWCSGIWRGIGEFLRGRNVVTFGRIGGAGPSEGHA